jgi:hypothetical protein
MVLQTSEGTLAFTVDVVVTVLKCIHISNIYYDLLPVLEKFSVSKRR